ncbi:MAG: hypothetical protein M0Q53_19615 [Prolixibacteraceae bacterium]|jgi:hypothetical protein|nr:hypothetical protein [Prolixibacteraceae bacterium]
MQHFITEPNWNERSVIDQVSKEVSSILPKRKLCGLIIDESGWAKKGVSVDFIVGTVITVMMPILPGPLTRWATFK